MSTKHQKGTSTDYSGSNDALLTPTSTVDHEKQCGKKVWRRRWRRRRI